MLVDINLKTFAVALILPVRDFVAQTVKIGIAAEIEITDQHSPQMANVTHFAVADAERAKKRDDRHCGDDPFHFERDRNGEQISLAVREQNHAGDQDAENRAGRSDSGYV